MIYAMELKHKIFGLSIACIGAMLAIMVAIVSYDPILISSTDMPSLLEIVFFAGIVVISGYAVFTGKRWWYESSFVSLGALLFLTINHVGSAIQILHIFYNSEGSPMAGAMAFNAAIALVFSVLFLVGMYLTYKLIQNKDISSHIRMQEG